jgi:hypothetical protein
MVGKIICTIQIDGASLQDAQDLAVYLKKVKGANWDLRIEYVDVKPVSL